MPSSASAAVAAPLLASTRAGRARSVGSSLRTPGRKASSRSRRCCRARTLAGVDSTRMSFVASRSQRAAAVPTAWPPTAQVAMTRVLAKAMWVALMLRPAKKRLAMLREW